MKYIAFCLVIWATCLPLRSQSSYIKLTPFQDGIHHWNLDHPVRNYLRLDSSQVFKIADNFVRWQNIDGGWPKNIDWLGVFNIDSARNVLKENYRKSTLDNRNIYTQIEYLSEVYSQTNIEKYRESAERGIRYILSNQNQSGGWRGWDVDAITYNDNVMPGVMQLLLNLSEKQSPYSWISDSLQKQATAALNKAINVTLRCQIIVDGKKTAWCQQHDHVTLLPIKARTFELPSITASESCGIVLFLMKLKNPTPEVVNSVESAVAWFKMSAIHGIRVQKVKIPREKIVNQEYPYDLIVINDTTAPPVWARYYEIDTNRPFMCNRNSIKVYKLEEVEYERRTGYAWYGYWPNEVLKEYEKWKKSL
jgi:PelA/Pel-15E family pectate lyase